MGNKMHTWDFQRAQAKPTPPPERGVGRLPHGQLFQRSCSFYFKQETSDESVNSYRLCPSGEHFRSMRQYVVQPEFRPDTFNGRLKSCRPGLKSADVI